MVYSDETRADRRVVIRAWRRIPFSTRLEVLHLAKRGKPHSDLAVDTAAVRFARAVLKQRSYVPGITVVAGFVLIAFAVWMRDSFALWILGAVGLLPIVLGIFMWDLRRDAKRVLAVPRNDELRQ